MATVMSSFLSVEVVNMQGEVLCLLDIYIYSNNTQFTYYILVYLCYLRVRIRTALVVEEGN